jgi:hypothetical protein
VPGRLSSIQAVEAFDLESTERIGRPDRTYALAEAEKIGNA